MNVDAVGLSHLGHSLLRAMAQAVHLETVPGRPYVFQVELTNFCNLKCPMCPHDLMTRDVGYMDFELFKDIVAQVGSTNPDLRLHNMGESLFHKDIGKFIRFANENHLETILSSNATTLTEGKIQELIDARLSWLYVSFDGTSAGTYERFRKGAHYEREKAKVERLLQMRTQPRLEIPAGDDELPLAAGHSTRAGGVPYVLAASGGSGEDKAGRRVGWLVGEDQHDRGGSAIPGG